MHNLAIALQAFVAASIFFVWVVRYATTSQEFTQLGLPDWVRDLVGILKLTFSLMLLIGIERVELALVGAVGICVLMAAAFITHLHRRNPLFKMLPSLTLLLCAGTIAWINFQLLTP